VIITFMIHNV